MMHKKLLIKLNIHLIKILQKVGIEGIYINIIKAIHSFSWLADSIPSKIRNKTETHSHLFNPTVLEVAAAAIKEKGNKRDPD